MDMDFKHLDVQFFTEPKEDKKASREAGRPVFADVEMVRIRIAGDPKSVLVAPAHDQSSARDPETNERITYAQLHIGPYEAFKRNQEFRGNGTPLSEATFLTAATRKTLEAANVFTIEALAGLDGTPLQKLGMGARGWKMQAEAYLAKASGTADVTRLAADNADLKQQVEMLRMQMEEMAGRGSVPREPTPPPANPDSPFNDWDDADLKAFIKDRTGDGVRGNPSHATLVARADEILASEKAEAA